MRSTERIAAEAIAATCGRLDEKTLNYAIEIGRTEALAELYLRKSAHEIPVYVLSGSSWNDILRHVRHIESGYFEHRCTNTAFNEWAREIDKADIVVLLKGWQGTKSGREKYAYAKHKGKNLVAWNNSEFSKLQNVKGI